MPFLNQLKGENERRKYFMINLHKRMLPTLVGVEPATSWSPVERASNRAIEASGPEPSYNEPSYKEVPVYYTFVRN